jgi:HAD superfamily hydrolase (TIGR01459 family)
MDQLPISTPIIGGLGEIAGRFDVALCDLWGVVHDGKRAFPEACEALTRFREGGGVVILLTNAPRPNGPIRDQLDRLFVPRAAYNAIVTSGDATIALLRAQGAAPLHHIGPDRDLSLFAAVEEETGEAPVRVSLADAAYVLCTGLFDDIRESTEDYDATLHAMRARDLLMICANPDLVIHRGQDLIYCAGAIAERYERLGGRTIYAGKPHPPIYALALSRAAKARGGVVDPKRVLAIGDGMRTDIAGAVGQGLETLFVAWGIHRDEVGGTDALEAGGLERLAARHGFRPTMSIDRLSW